MYPILGRYGPFLFYSYTAALGVGLFVVIGLAARQARRNPAAARWIDGLLVGLFAALLGGRLVYVATNWVYFQDHLDETWLLWQGGLSYHGALASGLLGLWLWCRVQGVGFTWLAGLLALPATVWSAFGWLACYLEGCAYGRETFIGFLAGDLPDSYGVHAVRYQTQLLGLALSLLAVACLAWLQRRLRPRHLFWLALLLTSLVRAGVSVWRGDPVLMVDGMRLDTLIDAGLAALAVVALLVSRRTTGDIPHDA